MPAWRSVTVGVADMDKALALWSGQFGFVEQTDWLNTRQLARRWKLDPNEVHAVRMLAAPGTRHGWVRLVAFARPGTAVRNGARAWDRCAKNLDIHVDDLAARLPALAVAGHAIHDTDPEWVIAPNGMRFRETHLPAHDGVNLVLLELAETTRAFSTAGYSGVTTVVSIVSELEAEEVFYQSRLSLQTSFKHRLAGPEVTRMIGLPDGASLDLCLLEEPGMAHGQVELVRYNGVVGDNRFGLATPPATGLLDVDFTRKPGVAIHSPAGLRLFVDPQGEA